MYIMLSKYFLTLEGICNICNDKCKECKDKADYCTKCENNKFVYEGECYASCVELGDGFGSASDFTCNKCNLDECIEYDDSCQCKKCNDGYGAVTDPSTQIEVCVPCSLRNCKNCKGTEANDCTECLAGYFLYDDETGQNKICTGCQVKNCKTCSEGGQTCQQCVDKYYLDSAGQCQQCGAGCLSCKGQDGSICELCDNGYFFKSEHMY